MIQLRWVIFGVNRQLEYRSLKLRIDASGALTPLPMAGNETDWTDWEIVPEIEGTEALYEDLRASGGIVGAP